MAMSSSPPPLSLLLCVSLLLSSTVQQPPSTQAQQQAVQAPDPSFMFGWLNNKWAYTAGDTAVIQVMSLDLRAAAAVRASLSFTFSVNGKEGNSRYVTDVAANIGADPNAWTISFVPLRAGNFAALVGEKRFVAAEWPLTFTVAAAGVHPSASRTSWTFPGRRVVAGSRAFISIAPRDAFGNGIARGPDMPVYFRVSGSYLNGSAVELWDFHYNGWTEDGRIGVEFRSNVAGDLLVHVYGDDRELRDSPLMLTVNPVSTCSWKHGINTLQLSSKLEMFIYQRDSFGNTVLDIHPFDAQVVDKASNLSIPIVDLAMEAVGDGVQLLSFNVVEAGQFFLTVFDAQLDERVSNTVHMFDVFVGYCDGSNSFANGSGLSNSIAGSASSFSVFLLDHYRIPSPVETARLQVKILGKNATSYADPIITPAREPNGPAGHKEIIAGNSNVQTSKFNVSYTPRIAGEYEIWVLCGNIVLNGGNPYAMTVLPGAVNMSLSSVVKFDPKVKLSVENEVVVRLVDSFMNPVVSFKSKLKFQLISASITSTTSFVAKEFVDNGDGSYTARYMARGLGSYGICVLYEDKQLTPCPFDVTVLADEYFSDVKNDTVSVWEDESISFDVLSNDRSAGSKVEIANSSSPLHGSVLQSSKTYRYTPFEGFFGNDSFTYTICDEHNNVVTATVFISVLCRPPQFISLPDKLHVTEDTISPLFGGFPGMKMVYSDTTENISVTVTAQSGSVFFDPVRIKLQQLSDDVLSIDSRGRGGKDLMLQGTIEVVNDALQFLLYSGNEDFHGNDVISLHASSRNGVRRTQFPTFVEPINDPPVILAPSSIFLSGNQSMEGHKIFDKHRDTFQFSIVEPDLHNFPGNKSSFFLVLSLEVLEGTLTTTLPSSAIATASMKTEGVNGWQTLQTYVTIANHFVLKGTAIRFRGSVQDCNNAMQQLHYRGPRHGTTLSITVNDQGNHGCYPDCSERMTMPLTTAKTIRLVPVIKTKHVNSRRTILFRWLAAAGIVIMLCLGCVLMCCLCKCMRALKSQRRYKIYGKIRTTEQTPFRQHMGASPSQCADAGYCPATATVPQLGANRSTLRQRSPRSCRQELELQPVSGTINNRNEDSLPVTDKDK
ncbi:protein GAMETE EXPRESSED 2-like isoform X2 [Miscanthus floridulus]|uniref:protein GAMETE EXPRESSED 2-like isoform X2 n=1 Tax=Miscanthus floridulus TaxID=154761 RepID=UPI0034595507